MYLPRIISYVISFTDSSPIPVAESNCFICAPTTLCLGLSETLNHILPCIVIICVSVCLLYETNNFLRVELCLIHLCASTDSQGLAKCLVLSG